MKHPAPVPTGPVVQPTASGQPSTLIQAGPQAQPDPWTIQGPAVYYAHAMVIGNPPGGPKGDGTLNAVAFYVNGALYDPTVFAPLAGATMTGSLILAHDPTATLEAATKNYVDNHIAAIPPPIVAGDAPPATPFSGQLWWNSLVGQLFVWYSDPNSSQWVVCNNALNSISLDMGTY
jgi:hypothetical protein